MSDMVAMGLRAFAVAMLAFAAPAAAGIEPPADPRILSVALDAAGLPGEVRWAASMPEAASRGAGLAGAQSFAVPGGADAFATSVGGVDVAAREHFMHAIDPGSSLLVRLADTSAAGKRLNLERSLSQVPGPGGPVVVLAAGAARRWRRRRA